METKEILNENGTEEMKTLPAFVSALSFVPSETENGIRIMVTRDLSVALRSFTVSYRFAGVGASGNVTESRFFTLTYQREGINSKELIAIRLKVPDEYKAVGCTAFVSKITYENEETDSVNFGDERASVVSSTADGISYDKLLKKKKGLSKGAKAVIALLSVALIAGGGTFLGINIARQTGLKNTVNGLVEEGRYGEAYKIAEVCSPSYVKTTCGNIISACLAERDYMTAYAYATVSGREESVFKRVEYEIETSGADALESDALAVLKKLDDDDKFDSIILKYIEKMKSEGNFPAAMTASDEIRNEVTRNLIHHNLIVDGACYYSADTTLRGLQKYDMALEYFHYYAGDDEEKAASLALEIFNKSVATDDAAGAIVLSSYFSSLYDSFEISPESIEVSAGNYSIRQSFDYSYPLLSDAQKRAFHEQKVAISEEAFVIKNGVIQGTSITNAVSVATYENRTAVLLSDGKAVHLENGGHNTVSKIPDGINGVQIAVGLEHTVILNADGTVVAVGNNSRGQCNVDDWTDIVEIACGRYFTVGLKSDGTLVACGSDNSGQCFIKGIKNVIGIACCDQTTALMFSDGTTMLRGYSSMGLREFNSFTGVVRIKAGGNTIIAETEDRTYLTADGSYGCSAGDTSNWDKATVSDFAVGSQCIAYLNTSGRLIISGDGT